MTPDLRPEVTALALNVAIPPSLQWTDTRRGEEFTLTSITVRMLPDGHLAAKAYGRPTNGGKGTYVSFPVPPATRTHRTDRQGGRRGQCAVGGSPGPRLALAEPRASATAGIAAGSPEWRSRALTVTPD